MSNIFSPHPARSGLCRLLRARMQQHDRLLFPLPVRRERVRVRVHAGTLLGMTGATCAKPSPPPSPGLPGEGECAFTITSSVANSLARRVRWRGFFKTIAFQSHIPAIFTALLLTGCTFHPVGEREERQAAQRAGAPFVQRLEQRDIPDLPANPTPQDLIHRAF